MQDEELQAKEQSLNKTKKVCKLISILMSVVFVALCIWWIASISVMTLTLFGLEIIENGGSISCPMLILYFASGLIMALICLTLIKIFSDTSKGLSPFTMLQVHRLRVVAIALVAYVVLEFALTYDAPFVSGASMSSSTYTINFFAIVSAGVVFAFSFVFKYGVLLQELSDETL